MSESLGLIAGEGIFPLLVARGAKAAGKRVVCVALKGSAWPDLESECDRARRIGLVVHPLPVDLRCLQNWRTRGDQTLSARLIARGYKVHPSTSAVCDASVSSLTAGSHPKISQSAGMRRDLICNCASGEPRCL